MSLNPGTPESAIEHVIDLVDLILVMSVNPGFGGQAFIPAATEKIAAPAGAWPADGRSTSRSTAASRPTTAPLVARAGANVLVAGSAVFKGGKPDTYRANIAAIRNAAADVRGESGVTADGTFVRTLGLRSTANRLLLAVAGAFLFATTAAAGDAAARRVLGFSADGKIFAFEQYTTIYEDEAAFAEYVIVDAARNRFVAGTPIKVLIRGDDGLDEIKARADAEAKAKPVLARFGAFAIGTHFAGQPSMALDEIGIYQLSTEPFASELDVMLPNNRAARLVVSEHPIAETTCDGYGGRATPAKAMGYGLKLTLDVAGAPPLVMQNDTSLPTSRRCAAGYGIAEAYLHRATDGTATLAVLVEYADNDGYHAGPNRRFLAVTKRLP